MPAVGEYVSDGKTWKPALRELRYPSPDKNGERPGEPILDPTTGKPLIAPDPAAVKSIKKELGFKETDAVPMEKLISGAAQWKSHRQNDTLDAIERLTQVLATRLTGAPIGANGDKLAMIDGLLKDPEVMAYLKAKTDTPTVEVVKVDTPPLPEGAPVKAPEGGETKRGVYTGG